MANINDLSHILSNVFLGGIIEGCLLQVEDNNVFIQAMDLTDSVFVQTVAELELKDCELGIGTLSVFTKYLESIKDVDTTLVLKGNRFVIKSKDGVRVSYLLTEPDFIASYDDEWKEIGDLVEEELKNFDESMVLDKEAIDKFLNVSKHFENNSVTFKVDGKGNVHLNAGPESGHQFDVKIGKIEDVDQCSIKLYSDNVTAVFKAIDYEKEPKMYISSEDDSPIVITNTATSWILRPMDQND